MLTCTLSQTAVSRIQTVIFVNVYDVCVFVTLLKSYKAHSSINSLQTQLVCMLLLLFVCVGNVIKLIDLKSHVNVSIRQKSVHIESGVMNILQVYATFLPAVYRIS